MYHRECMHLVIAIKRTGIIDEREEKGVLR